MTSERKKELVRVIRVLEYIGPRDWILDTLEKSWAGKENNCFLGNFKSVKEIASTLTILRPEEKGKE